MIAQTWEWTSIPDKVDDQSKCFVTDAYTLVNTQMLFTQNVVQMSLYFMSNKRKVINIVFIKYEHEVYVSNLI